MKILGIVCSNRKGGNTEILTREALTGASDCGAETELVSISNIEIKPCDGCLSCTKTYDCRIKDDMHLMYEKMLSADGIILGTPVYFWSPSGQAKIIIDRTLPLRYPYLKLANKVGGAIAVAGRDGADSALGIIEHYFSSNHMFLADSVNGLALEKGVITKDKHAMKSAYEMGRQMVLILKQQFKAPQEFNIPIYKLVQKKYGTKQYPEL